MEKKNNVVYGPIDKGTWNALRLYRSSLDYHKGNDKVLNMVRPIYDSLKQSIKKEVA